MLLADLVVDATGRGSRSAQWLESLGYGRVEESTIRIDVGYATRIYRRRAGDLPGAAAMIISPTPPADKRCGVLLPMEGDRWILTLGGWCGDHAPADDAGVLAFARSLAAPAIGDLAARAEPLGEIVIHRFPSNLRRRHERMRRFPEGYLVFGDALSSFNPIYGQGMTSSAMQSRALGEVMAAARRAARLDGTWRTFFRRAARVVDIPWMVTAGEDFRYPEVEGPRPPATDLINRYVAQVHRAASEDEEVYRAFLYVMNLAKAPPSVFAPATAVRVGLAAWRRRGARPTASSRDWVPASGRIDARGSSSRP
jgi:2-polyprenyl-6-methoxyphenol hydroxylase-like FAD-dependent oxidoreductase